MSNLTSKEKMKLKKKRKSITEYQIVKKTPSLNLREMRKKLIILLKYLGFQVHRDVSTEVL